MCLIENCPPPQPQVIYPEGDTLCDFYVLLSGRVAITVDGRKLATLVDRSHFGELEVGQLLLLPSSAHPCVLYIQSAHAKLFASHHMPLNLCMQVHGHSDRVTTATALDVTHVIRVQNRVYVTTWPKVAEHERYVQFMQVRCLFVLRAAFFCKVTYCA